MVPSSNYRRNDRIHISRAAREKAGAPSSRRRIRPMTVILLVAGTVSCLWGLSKWGQDSSGAAQETEVPHAPAAAERTTAQAIGQSVSVAAPASVLNPAVSSPIQGPAIDVPREIVEMLDLRKKELDRREEWLRSEGERLRMLRAEIEQILSKYEQAVEAEERRRKAAQDELAKAEKERKAREEQQAGERREKHQKELAKMYEAMEPEEAAVRLEKLPDRQAIAVLRLLKGKTAGAILAQVNPVRAAKLTAQLLVTP